MQGRLHYDHHFERLGKLLGIRTLWVSEPSRAVGIGAIEGSAQKGGF
jgi:hypothetical protein